MTEHQETETGGEEGEGGSRREGLADALSATVLILLAVAACIYFVSNM